MNIFLIAWCVVCMVCMLMMQLRQAVTFWLQIKLMLARLKYRRINETVLSLEDEQNQLIHEMNDICDKLARRLQNEAYDRV